jgi:hypothetical protein
VLVAVLLFLPFFVTTFFPKQVENIEYITKGVFENTQKTFDQNEPVQGKPILIRLERTHFDPLRNLPSLKPGIPEIQSYEAGEIGYYIVQFDGPIKDSWKNDLRDIGAEVFDYVPEYAFIIKMDSRNEQIAQSIPHVRWLGIYQPSYKISQQALDKMYTKAGELIEEEAPYEELRITVFPGENLERIKSEIIVVNGTIMDTVTTRWRTTLRVKIRTDKIAELAPISGIKWVEPIPAWKHFNNVSTDILNVRIFRDTYGLYGQGQTVGICDGGLDAGSTDPANLNDDFEDGSGNSRVTQIFDLVGDGANDVNNGHGTHVVGSILGNGFNSGSDPTADSFPATCFAGIAPKANLIFQAVEDNVTGALSGVPLDLNILFGQADGAGADLHTNSWGSPTNGIYTSYSQDVDQYVWDNPDFLILFATGNEGTDKDGDGVIDLYSMGAPASAKNCVTVGASEGNRQSGAGYDFTWGTYHPFEYSTDPIFPDHLSDYPGGIAAFSGRGPVIDGRFKPDLVAPGTNILSVRSSDIVGQQLWGNYNNDYLWSGGTSMGTPLAAGSAALVREYLINERGHSQPSAALIKAALLNSAEDLSPGQYGTGSTQEIPNPPVPNNVQGWGRLNFGSGVYPVFPFNIIYHDERNGLNTTEYRDHIVYVSDSNYPLRINLVWTDYPGSPAAQGGLVNDLDLQATDPTSNIHYADNASQKSTVSTLTYDKGNPDGFIADNRRAMKITPLLYPAYVESATFAIANPMNSTANVDVVVYDDDGTGGLPGTELFRKTLTYIPQQFSWGGALITIGIAGVVINSGDFYVAIEKTDLQQYIAVDDGNPTGRSYYHDGSQWIQSSFTAYIGANVRGTDHSVSFDRVNNAVGLTLSNPATGTYTIRVSGFNVPQGQQSYAIVISGAVAGPPIVSTGSASSVTSSSADLNGTVNPNGMSATYYFEYGLTSTYGSSSSVMNTGPGNNRVPVNTIITIPDPLATYHFRLVAVNTAGTSYGQDRTFTNDTDADSMPDDWERGYFGDLSHDGTLDSENDGLTDLQEYQNGTDPTNSDSDADYMPDGWEVTYGLVPVTDDANGDLDGDGFNNLQEYFAKTNPADDTSYPAPDFGDAPDPTYVSMAINIGADHVVFDNEWLGDDVNGESDSIQVNDDLFDDGVIFKDILLAGVATDVDIKVNVLDSTDTKRYDPTDPKKRLYLNAWFDWNADGDWNDPGEKVIGTGSGIIYPGYASDTIAIDPTSSFGGINSAVFTFSITSPVDWPIGGYARFRLDYGEDAGAVQNISGTLSEYMGAAQFGEVEDYKNPLLALSTIDVNGGNVTVIDPGGEYDGCQVVVPAGALNLPTDISVQEVPNKDALPATPDGGVSILIEIRPTGTLFNIPITITVPHDPSLVHGNSPQPYFWDAPNGLWSASGISNIVYDESSDPHTVTFDITHLTAFGVDLGIAAGAGGGGGGGGGG